MEMENLHKTLKNRTNPVFKHPLPWLRHTRLHGYTIPISMVTLHPPPPHFHFYATLTFTFPWLHSTHFHWYTTNITMVMLHPFPWLRYTHFHDHATPISVVTLKTFLWLRYTYFCGYTTLSSIDMQQNIHDTFISKVMLHCDSSGFHGYSASTSMEMIPPFEYKTSHSSGAPLTENCTRTSVLFTSSQNTSSN